MKQRLNAFIGVGLMVVLVGIPPASLAQQSEQDAVMRMRSVGQAMLMYANENKAFLPPSLAELSKYLPKDFAEGVQRDFVYAVPPATRINRIKQPATTPVAMTRPANNDQPIAILFADGHVQLYAPTDGNGAGPSGASPNAIPEPAAPPSQAVVPTGDVVKDLVGLWQTAAGAHTASYEFRPDGSFAVTFTPVVESRSPNPIVDAGTGSASGTWRVDGKRLVMTNGSSNTLFAVVGEEETGEVVSLGGGRLVLRTTDRKGKPEDVTFDRVVPFAKGKRTDEHIVGTWTVDSRGGGGAMTLVLADSGMAVFAGMKGEWSQHGGVLELVFGPAPDPSAFNQQIPQRRRATTRDASRQLLRRRLTIDLINDTTLVLTGPLLQEASVTLPFLRVK